MKAIERLRILIQRLSEQDARRVGYMHDLISEHDWHGVMDASADIRVKRAQIEALEQAIKIVISESTTVEPLTDRLELAVDQLRSYGATIGGERKLEAEALAARLKDFLEDVRRDYQPGEAP